MNARVRVLVVVAAALLLPFTTAHAGLLGETVTADLGINLTHGPFDPDYILQIPFNSAVVGPEVEFGNIFGAAADFDDTGLSFTNIEASMGDFPFNGFRFIINNPTVTITSVQLASTTIVGLNASHITFRPDAIAVNSVHDMVGSLRLTITTVPAVVAVENITWGGVKALYQP